MNGRWYAEIVVEPVLDHGTYRHLRLGEELLHRVGEQVRRRVADDLEPLPVLVGDDRDIRVGGYAVRGVHETVVDLAGERGFRQPRAYGLRHLAHRNRLLKGTDRTVREFHLHHRFTCLNSI